MDNQKQLRLQIEKERVDLNVQATQLKRLLKALDNDESVYKVMYCHRDLLSFILYRVYGNRDYAEVIANALRDNGRTQVLEVKARTLPWQVLKEAYFTYQADELIDIKL